VEEGQKRRLAALRARRDNAAVAEILARLEQAARGSENLMPLFIAAAERYATLGEITGVLRKVWGEYRPAL